MIIGDAVRKAMKETKTTQVKLAERLSNPERQVSQTVISERLNHSNMSVNLLLEMLDKLDYELVIQPKKRGRRPEGQILVGDEE